MNRIEIDYLLISLSAELDLFVEIYSFEEVVEIIEGDFIYSNSCKL